jgi:hypothetical protein
MFGLGVAGQNIGGQMSFGEGSYPFPTNYGAGVSFEHGASGVRADVDFNAPSDYYTNVRGGVEWSWQDRLAIRAGYRRELGAASDDALNGPSFGVGAGAYGMWLDYGFLVTPSGEGQHRMGLTLHPGRMSWSAGDPFDQKSMPREFGPAGQSDAATPGKDGSEKKD